LSSISKSMNIVSLLIGLVVLANAATALPSFPQESSAVGGPVSFNFHNFLESSLNDWNFCSYSSECSSSCCSKEFSDDGRFKCTPRGSSSQCANSLPPAQNPGSLKKDWDFCAGSNECDSGCCSSQYSNDGKLKCTPRGSSSQCSANSQGPSGSLKKDWDFCTGSNECGSECCSREFSNDGMFKCSPKGSSSQCVSYSQQPGSTADFPIPPPSSPPSPSTVVPKDSFVTKSGSKLMLGSYQLKFVSFNVPNLLATEDRCVLIFLIFFT
jgi:hypothetical protein